MKNISCDIAIIGGGASGIMAGITAARNGAKVVILEHTDKIAKKILSTGNGRCNFTNDSFYEDCYRGCDPKFADYFILQFDNKKTVEFFEDIGLMTTIKDGYYYPYSNQAISVRDVLIKELKRLKIKIVYNFNTTSINKTNDKFEIHSDNSGNCISKKVIIATGGMAAAKTGSDGSGYKIAQNLNHKIIKPLPALVPLISNNFVLKSASGVRCDIVATLFIDNKEILSQSGQLQITDYGLSGIVIFQLSRYVSYALEYGKNVSVNINFFPSFTQKELYLYLKNRFLKEKLPIESALIGTLNNKLIVSLLKNAHIKTNTPSNQLTGKEFSNLIDNFCQFNVNITGVKSFDMAQVSAGGVSTNQLNNKTLESNIIKGIYFAGEIIDIDGKCGGYNLQWAFTSGYVAGTCASKGINK